MARALSTTVYLASPERGVDGRGVISGARAPLMTDGRVGDFWLDTAAKKLYGPKNSAAWPDNGLIKGDSGWTPVFAAVNDGSRRVQRVVDWVGGAGSKPATGKYVGAAGLVDAIGDALDIRGPEGPQSLIDGLDAATEPLTDATLISTAEEGDDNKKRPAVEIYDIGSVLERLSVAEAIATTVRQKIKRIRTQYYAPDGNDQKTFVGGAHYRRVNEQPTHLMKFRSTDRYTAEGSVDAANGGWWELDEPYPTLEMGGAIGDGLADDQTPYTKLLSYGRPITLVRGKTYLVSNAANPNGIPIIGEGKLVTAVTGGQRQHNSFADLAPRVYYGNEYLDRAYQFLQVGQSSPSGKLNVHLFGDSTVSGNLGEYQKVEQVVSAGLSYRGIPNHSVTNHAVGGTSWSDLDAIPFLSSGTALFIIKYGINDAEFGFSNFVNQMRTKLAAIRGAGFGSVGSLSIILVGPTATSDSPNGRDERWYEMINGAIRAAAREFQCAFFDGYVFMRDARGAAGLWMDNPYSDGRAVHPIKATNARLWGAVMDAFFGSGMVAPFAVNYLVNEGGVSSQKIPGNAPSTFKFGVSLHRAVSGDGWPIDGVVVTHRNVDGPAMQYLYGYAANATRIMTRIANLSGDSWNIWTGERVALTLQNSWVNYGGSLAGAAARIASGGLVVLEGTIKDGNQTGGTVLANLPAGMRPAAEVLCLANVYATNAVATIRIKPNGDIVGELGLNSSLTSLGGISFLAA